jgi:hypothetical protein
MIIPTDFKLVADKVSKELLTQAISGSKLAV